MNPHTEHREAARRSIICSGCLEAGSHRGWPETGAWRLRTPDLPAGATRLRTPDLSQGACRLRTPDLPGGATRLCSSGFQERHPVVGAWSSDGLGERHAARHLAPRHAPGQLPHALHDLREAGGGERVATRLEATGGVDRQAAVERGLTVERGRSSLSGRKEPDVLERDQLERGEGVVDLGDVDTLRA